MNNNDTNQNPFIPNGSALQNNPVNNEVPQGVNNSETPQTNPFISNEGMNQNITNENPFVANQAPQVEQPFVQEPVNPFGNVEEQSQNPFSNATNTFSETPVNQPMDNPFMSQNNTDMNQGNTAQTMAQPSINPQPIENGQIEPALEPMSLNDNANPFINNTGMDMNQNMMNSNVNPNPNLNNDLNAGMNQPAQPIDLMMQNGGDTPNSGKKPKKPVNKTAVFLIVVVLLAAVAFGVYYMLNMAKPKTTVVTITPKDVVLELGSTLPTSFDDFATVSGYNKDSCTIDTSKVDMSKMDKYSVSLTCGVTKKDIEITVKDTKAPTVVTKKVYVLQNTTDIKLASFIDKCTDASGTCGYDLDSSIISLQTLAQTLGTHKIKIVVSDKYDNEVTVETEMIVTTNLPVKNLYCQDQGESMSPDGIEAMLTTAYNYGMNEQDTMVYAENIMIYSFNTEADYLKIKNSYQESSLYKISTSPIYDDELHTITLKKDLTLAELNELFTPGSVFPTTTEEIKNVHIAIGNLCKLRIP